MASFDSFATSITPKSKAPLDPTTHTQTPVTTGTSIIAVKFDKGVVIAGDTLGSYGSLARFRCLERVVKVNEKTMIGCMGDYADFQFLKQMIEQMAINDICKADNIEMTPRSLHSWLTRVLYNKRSKIDPLWTTIVVGGVEDDGTPFLGFVDKLGTAYQDRIIATGFGAQIATPFLRNVRDTLKAEKKTKEEQEERELTEAEAVKSVQKCMEIMYYRDARAHNKYNLGVVTAEGSRIDGPLVVEADWAIARLAQ